jgi:hypothetical protein
MKSEVFAADKNDPGQLFYEYPSGVIPRDARTFSLAGHADRGAKTNHELTSTRTT